MRSAAIVLLLALASGCATKGMPTDGLSEVVDPGRPTPKLRERLAGGGAGMLKGALAGVGGAIALTGGDPEATFYVSMVTVPACVAIGLFSGLNQPASMTRAAPPPRQQYAAADVSPEIQSLVRTVANEVRDRRSRTRKK